MENSKSGILNIFHLTRRTKPWKSHKTGFYGINSLVWQLEVVSMSLFEYILGSPDFPPEYQLPSESGASSRVQRRQLS